MATCPELGKREAICGAPFLAGQPGALRVSGPLVRIGIGSYFYQSYLLRTSPVFYWGVFPGFALSSYLCRMQAFFLETQKLGRSFSEP